MTEINLSSEEIRMLRDALIRYLPDLRMEIADTDDKEFRHFLEERETFMWDFVERLELKMAA